MTAEAMFGATFRDECGAVLAEERADASNSLLVLLYHGVSREKQDAIWNYNNKFISVDDFAKDLRILCAEKTILSIEEVVEMKERGIAYPENSVVITFDDGYQNNATVAAPVLSDFKVPAVFYVCPGMIDTNLEFWTDRIAKLIGTSLERELVIKINDEIVQFSTETEREKVQAIDGLKKICKTISVTQKDLVIEQLENIRRCSSATWSNEECSNISWDQVKNLDSDELFTVGGHSLYHDVLSKQDVDAMENDIEICQKLLAYKLGHKVEHFSYPEGGVDHFNKSVINQLKANGVVCSPSGICGLNSSKVDLFHLKRVMVGLYGLSLPR